MDLQQWQAEFDNKKWIDSLVAGGDVCGSYEFCVKCNKDDEFPCARAFKAFNCPQKARVRIAVLRPRA